MTGLKPNLYKCELAGIGVLKGFKVRICGIKCIDLTKEAVKILWVLVSAAWKLLYKNNIKYRKKFLKSGDRGI